MNDDKLKILLHKKRLRHTLFIAIALTFVLCIPNITMLVSAADIIVDDDGTGDYTTIQAAINAASPGDTIWIKDGSYNEQLVIDRTLNILADNGATPIIYATSYSPGIDVTASDVIFDGIKIYGNSAPGGGPTIRASAGSDNLKVRNCFFTAIPGEIGNTCLLITSGVSNVQFTANDARDYEYGIVLESGSSAIVPSNNHMETNHTFYQAAHVEGTTLYYGSIQDAIDTATEDGIVTVLPATYNENIVIDKPLTLNGNQRDAHPNSGRTGEESIIDGVTVSPIRIAADVSNVTINGFTLTIGAKDASSNQAGVIIGPNTSYIQVINNIIHNITDGGGPDTTSDEGYGVMVYGHIADMGQREIIISYNVIENVEEYGIAINDNTSSVIISHNKIINLIGSDHSADPIWDPSWPDLVCSAIHLGGQVGPISDIHIHSNILSTNNMGDGVSTSAGSGISFAGVTEWLPPNRVWQGFQDIFIANNGIFNNTMGLYALTGSSNGTIDVNGNNISDNTVFGLINTAVDASFNATENWWGSILGPYNATDNPDGLGDNVTGNITFWPWYERGTSAGGFSNPPEVIYSIGIPSSDNDGTVISDTTEIKLFASDNESGMHSLTYRTWDTVNRWSSWMNYTDSITLSGEGNHRVQYNATDNAGTSAGLNSWEIQDHRVDTISPDVSVHHPNGGEFIFGSLDIEWEASDKIRDQEQALFNGSMSITGDYPGHIQSFIPTENVIDSIQLLLTGDDAEVTVILFSDIDPVPAPLAQSTVRLQNIANPSSPAWVDFPFDSTIGLDTESTYYIGVTQQIYGNTGFQWYYFNASGGDDPYDYGNAYIKKTDSLENKVDWDWGFRTMYWNDDITINVEFSMTGSAPWSTIVENTANDGSYSWDTSPFPDGENYKVRVVARDELNNLGVDESDETFRVDNDGPAIYDITIMDTTVSSSEFVKNGDTVEITATVTGNPQEITADLTGFGLGSNVSYTSYTGGVAKWMLQTVSCIPANGPITITIRAEDTTGDTTSNYASIIADNTEPSIDIIKPGPGFYFMDGMRLLPFAYPFIIGQITISVEADDEHSGIEKVEYYLENDLEATVTEVPYNWLWDRAATGFFDLEIRAYDTVGHVAVDEINDLFIINLDIIGSGM